MRPLWHHTPFPMPVVLDPSCPLRLHQNQSRGARSCSSGRVRLVRGWRAWPPIPRCILVGLAGWREVCGRFRCMSRTSAQTTAERAHQTLHCGAVGLNWSSRWAKSHCRRPCCPTGTVTTLPIWPTDQNGLTPSTLFWRRTTTSKRSLPMTFSAS